MVDATEKQINALKRLTKFPNLANGILKDIEFDGLDKKEASELISKCNELLDNKPTMKNDNDFQIIFRQTHTTGSGHKESVELYGDDLEKVRSAHAKHCQKILMELEEEYPDDRGLQLAMFEKRCDKIFTWIQQALSKKYSFGYGR